ncbi:hypothetical protein TWF694_003472 [Orbilia ellipsospora]|uniref:Uncharacterized protein n=1 Tax=Orbilia ellipsospora TaxID=2528407 RepID=A0AAV9WYC7_9PEZI
MPQSRRPPPSSSSTATPSSKSKAKQSRDLPGQSKKKTGNSGSSTTTTTKVNAPLLRQFKTILTTFHDTFSHLFTPNLPSIIQSVKQSLYLRDYVSAFDSPEKLQAYVVRWSVARALAYSEMISTHWWSHEVTQCFIQQDSVNDRLKIACIGGGAGAELAGIAAAYSSFTAQQNPREVVDEEPLEGTVEPLKGRGLDLTLLDFATWSPIVDSLYDNITDSTGTSQIYLEKSDFTAKFHQQDVLSPLSEASISSLASADIITILFTAGELYSQSSTLTTKFLISLHALAKPGALLVIVDSAGGFEDLDILQKGSSRSDKQSNATNNNAIGGYKLGFLLDKTLTNRQKWEIIASEDAKWWRAPQELKEEGDRYPLELENMRCLMRVYRRNNED